MNFVNRSLLVAAAWTCFATAPSPAQPLATHRTIVQQTVVQPQPGVSVISSDAGIWGGLSTGTSHQNSASFWTEKTLVIPEGGLKGVQQARLRVFMLLFDNSRAEGSSVNGLDEAFELIVNGKTHLFKSSDPALPAALPGESLIWKWHDFIIPLSELRSGVNTFVFRKTPSSKNDDFLYIGIDNSVTAGQSRSSLDNGKTWRSGLLNTIDATGEYMARLVLLKNSQQSHAIWTPQRTTDPQHLIGYSEKNADTPSSNVRIELDPYRFDAAQPFKVAMDYRGAPPEVRWFDENEKPLEIKFAFENGKATAQLPPRTTQPTRLEVAAPEGKPLDLQQVRFDYSLPVGDETPKRTNMAPRVLPARGKPLQRAPKVQVNPNGFTAQNSTLAARFETKPSLRLVSLRSEYLQKNILAQPEATQLFLIEVNGKRYGAQDWTVQGVKAVSPTQVAVQLALPAPALQAQLTIGVDAQNLRFGLKITNTTRQTQSWKTAFPHIGGIELSPKSTDDYYLFPMWGGAISNVNVDLKTIYGDESAWWQMVDVFSPAGGSGMMLRSLDETGLFKSIALRKGRHIVSEGSLIRDTDSSAVTGYLEPGMGWHNTLAAAPGVSTTFEYLKYTRAPGGSFSPPSAALQMHPGDWHTAMKTYADWAHRVWKWTPWPSKLRDVWNIQGPGWGQDPLYKDGKWKTDYINDKSDVSELMSWWQWSKKGPWQVPMDRLKEELGESFFKAYSQYWVVNPATGQLEYPLNRGDYEYNTDWGGLPALRKQLQTIRDGGQMPMFYSDPILADDNTKLGHEYGLKYGVMNPLWKPDTYSSPKKTPAGYVGSYGGYNMCLDNQWYQDFVVEQTARIVRDTGVDGIRFDEFGHRGYVCHNPQHQHIFAEKGHNAWLQAVTQLTRRTQEAAKKVKPDFVLTTEFPGYDHLAATLEGAVNYESGSNVFRAFRPIPLNVMRFYFPEHKHFDLDGSGRVQGPEWRFWNATGTSFARVHPPLYHRILEENGDTFDSREVTPLAPNLAQGVYANRFAGGGKTITVLYNARGFTIDEPLLTAPTKDGFHYFDLLNGRELEPQKGSLAMKLRPDKVAAIAHLPQVLRLQEVQGGWQVSLSRPVPNASIVLCNAEGEAISRQTVKGGTASVAAPPDSNAAYVKLLQGKYLLDAARLP